MITDIAFSPDGRLLAVAGRDVACAVWDAATFRSLTILAHQNAWGVSGIGFSPDGQTLVTTSEDQTIRLWDVAKWRERAVLPDSSGRVREGCFAPDASALVTGGEDGSVRVWQLPLTS
ncbi:MAG: hypothetical protein L0Z50_31605 [Verrucomicrobiales bacterium]|nr:hypothetical protein [Verrucomicrobiales bacterium]